MKYLFELDCIFEIVICSLFPTFSVCCHPKETDILPVLFSPLFHLSLVWVLEVFLHFLNTSLTTIPSTFTGETHLTLLGT